VDAAGAQDAIYQHDSFEDPSPQDDRKFNAIGDYLLFARTFDELSNDDLLLEFSELNVEGGLAVREPILQVHRRWARDVLAIARTQPALETLL
jgi:hypothetical protein